MATDTTLSIEPDGQTAAPGTWAALSVVYVLWGSTYLGIAIVVEQLPPLLSAASRFGAAALILVLIVTIRSGWRRLKITRQQLAGTALIALLLPVAGNGAVSLAERYVPSSLSALLVSIVPVWIVLIRRFSGQRPARATWLGVGFGLVGVVGIVATTGSQDPSPGTGYVDVSGWLVAFWLIAVALGSLSWAFGSFISPSLANQERLPSDALASTAWQMGLAGIILAVLGFGSGESVTAFGQMTGRTIAAWIFITVAVVAAYGCYVWLLQNAPVSLVSTYAYVNPVVAVFLGWLLLDEPMNPALLGVAVLVLIGVVLVVRGESRVKPPPPDQ